MNIKNNIQIGFCSKKNNFYLWNGEEEIKCNICQKKQGSNFVLNTILNSLFKEIEQYSYCMSCYEKIKKHLEGTHTLVVIEHNRKRNLIPVIPDSLLCSGKRNTNESGGAVFLSDEELEKEDTSKLDISRAKVSFNPNRNKMDGFEENLIQFKNADELLDKPIETEEEVLDFLTGLKETKPEITHKKKGEIGYEKRRI